MTKKVMKFNRIEVITYLVIFWFFLLFLNPIAQGFEEKQKPLSFKQLLLMPGDLTQPHAKIESECKQCHSHFDKSNQSPLCIDCHEKINNDLIESTGFHGTLPKKSIEKCSSCHTDHKGRDFNIISLDEDHFNHDNTEFSLNASHVVLDCNECHKSSAKNFRIKLKPGKCASCHDDPHEGGLKNDCLQCHDEERWQISEFDHSKTNFLLKGKHEKLACTSCHVNDVSAEIGTQCVTCHLSKDKHFNVFGNKCQSCHNEKGWDKTNYDHFKETKFSLRGNHKKLTCKACHSIANTNKQHKTQNIKKTCSGCHKNDDVHLGHNGKKCQDCHNNTSWDKTNFNHDDTDYFLQGSHQKLSCDACHLPDDSSHTKNTHLTPKATSITARACIDCHKLTDPHNGGLGKKCQECHQQEKWQEDVIFNHDFTLFPLTGAHQLQVCQGCHFSADFTIKSFQCIDCHRDDDPHQPSIGNKCMNCHNSSTWTTWQFDHQLQTDFPLTGAHENLNCVTCHHDELVKPLSPPQACFSCHKSDDAHQGSFGRNCAKCHNTDSFYDFKY